MMRCNVCNTMVDKSDDVCPVCGADSSNFVTEVDISRKKREEFEQFIQRRDSLFAGDQEINLGERADHTIPPDIAVLPKEDAVAAAASPKSQADEVFKKGKEYMESARKWNASGNRSRAREHYQRAFRFFERALKLDPDHAGAKQAKSRCLGKMV